MCGEVRGRAVSHSRGVTPLGDASGASAALRLRARHRAQRRHRGCTGGCAGAALWVASCTNFFLPVAEGRRVVADLSGARGSGRARAPMQQQHVVGASLTGAVRTRAVRQLTNILMLQMLHESGAPSSVVACVAAGVTSRAQASAGSPLRSSCRWPRACPASLSCSRCGVCVLVSVLGMARFADAFVVLRAPHRGCRAGNADIHVCVCCVAGRRARPPAPLACVTGS